MVEEYDALHKNNTFELVLLLKGCKLIQTWWLYKIKHHANGTVERHKA